MSGATTLEMVWTGIAVVALLFSLWLTGGGWYDLAAVRAAIRDVPPRARTWGPRWWVALSTLVANGVLSVVWAAFVAIGILAMLTSPDADAVYRAWVSSVTGWLLIAGFLLIALVQAWHLYVRRRVEQSARGGPL